jgi:hypothetical protein
MSPSARRLIDWAARRAEALLTAVAALSGLWLFAANATGSLFWAAVGLGLMILALLNLRGALIRLRLALGGDGPGVVVIDEGQIGYLGPETGGVTAFDLIDRVALVPGRALTLYRRDGAPIVIPLSADGADMLIDALAALPGFDPARLTLARNRAAPETVWVRGLDLDRIARHR